MISFCRKKSQVNFIAKSVTINATAKITLKNTAIPRNIK